MTHPRIATFEQLTQPAQSAAAMGYVAPPQWQPLEAVWVCQPHNRETWPRCLDKARRQFDTFTEKLGKVVTVSSTDSLGITTDDSWIRDYGPIFVMLPDAQASLAPLACHDFHFNGWGNKYDRPDRDDVVPQHIARHLGLPLWLNDFVLEGGAFDVNGRGSLITTEQCLLHPNRNPTLDRQQIAQKLRDSLGVEHIIWLPGGISGDDTDGHVDDVARFVNPNTIVAARASAGSPDRPDHDILEDNWAALSAAHDQDGECFNLIELPMPQPIYYDYPPDRFDAGGRAMLPASYANFLITNSTVWVPVFGQERDDIALDAISLAMPGYNIHPIRSEWLVVGQGGLNCLTMGQPLAARSF